LCELPQHPEGYTENKSRLSYQADTGCRGRGRKHPLHSNIVTLTSTEQIILHDLENFKFTLKLQRNFFLHTFPVQQQLNTHFYASFRTKMK